MKKEKTTQGYMQLQMITGQLSQLHEQFRMVDSQLAELENIKNSVDELQDIKTGSEMFAPISNGIFVKSKLQDNENFIVNMGGGITISKDHNQLRGFLDKQSNDLKKFQTDLLTRIQSLNLQTDYLKKEISKYAK